MVQLLEEMYTKIFEKRDFTGLWVPTHLVHDAETDDQLCWLILEYVHRHLGTQLHVLIQLPNEREFDVVQRVLAKPEGSGEQPRVKVFRDVDSGNQVALRAAFSWALSNSG